MLEHQKIILKGVADDDRLFRKELLKSVAWLKSYEIIELKKWLSQQYGLTHQDIINHILQPGIKNRAGVC